MIKYKVFKVHFEDNTEKKNIEEVKVFVHDGDNNEIAILSTTTPLKFKKKEVIEQIKFNTGEFVTIYKKVDGGILSNIWNRGAKVIVEEIGDEEFIKTAPNGKKEDNLGELPTY